MRTLKQQQAKALRDANRAHDAKRAQANALHPSGMCQQGYHAFCINDRHFCTCECHRPKATARVREEM